MRLASFCQGSRRDAYAMLLLLTMTVAGHLPEVSGLFKSNPVALYAGVASSIKRGLLPGYSYIDPNVGSTSQALGRRAVLEWLEGHLPWWNPYAGVGLPLAGDMQSAAFFPPTLLYIFDNGHLYLHILLQFIAGVFTYILLRQLVLSRTAALVGGVLYQLNGTFAWFAHASFLPVAFLPMMLVGVESTRRAAQGGQAGGWGWLAGGLALSLYAGFPETAYINGLLVAVWTLLRGMQMPRPHLLCYGRKIITGGLVGLGLAAPILVAFFDYLPYAFLGNHANGGFAYARLDSRALPMLLVPYLYGNIFAHHDPEDVMTIIWGNVGGYLGPALFVLSVLGLLGCQDRMLRWVLGMWIGLTLAKTFGVRWAMDLFNLLPFIKEAAFFRYAPPSWEMAATVLAAFAIEDLRKQHPNILYCSMISLSTVALMVGLVLFTAQSLIDRLVGNPHFWLIPLSSTVWATAVMLVIPMATTLSSENWRRLVLVTVVSADALLLFMIPSFANPRDYNLSLGGIEFLQKNLGLQRFYSLGPIAPNYGSYFGIASINHIDAPIPARWTDYIAQRLDTNSGHPSDFLGTHRRNQYGPSAADELYRNLANYEAIGVKYVVVPAGENPLLRRITFGELRSGNVPAPITDGETISGRLPGTIPPGRILGLQILIGTYAGHADGRLRVQLQTADGRTAEAGADVAQAADNQFLMLRFLQPLQIEVETTAQFSFTHTESTSPVALWRFPADTARAQALQQGNTPLDGQLAIRLVYQGVEGLQPGPVYQDKVMSIYELPASKGYFEPVAGNCTLQVFSREALRADCATSSTLLRRELYFPGWRAMINGAETSISVYDNLLQQIEVPAGQSTVRFVFRPPYIEWAALATGIALLFLLSHGVARARSSIHVRTPEGDFSSELARVGKQSDTK